jgi:hypothetical protein
MSRARTEAPGAWAREIEQRGAGVDQRPVKVHRFRPRRSRSAPRATGVRSTLHVEAARYRQIIAESEIE